MEFKKFLTTIDARVPQDLDVHLICDIYGTHKSPAIITWLAAHPRFTVHHTPTYSSWINQVERWFGFLTEQLLQRSDLNRPGVSGDFHRWEGWSHAREHHQEVPAGVEGEGGSDGC